MGVLLILKVRMWWMDGLLVLRSLGKVGGRGMESESFRVSLPVLVMVMLGVEFGSQISIFSFPILTYFLYLLMNLFSHRLPEPLPKTSPTPLKTVKLNP